jgi:hypothetical protein
MNNLIFNIINFWINDKQKKIISKWLLPNEIGILTTELKKITYENLIAVTKFSGGNDIIINFFKRYL